jgi:hypothetical protein
MLDGLTASLMSDRHASHAMRWWAVVGLVLVLLSGCSQPAAQVAAPDAIEPRVPDVVDPAWANGTRLTLVEGSAPWKSDSYELVGSATTQVLFGFCRSPLQDGVSSDQFHLSEVLPHGPAPNETTAVEVTASWSDEDHLGEALRMVLFFPEKRDLSLLLARDVPTRLDLGDGSFGGAWDLWLCTTSQVPSGPNPFPTENAFPFVGDVAVKVDLLRE